MKISAALVPFILAQTEAGKGKSDVCQACDGKFQNLKYNHDDKKYILIFGIDLKNSWVSLEKM